MINDDEFIDEELLEEEDKYGPGNHIVNFIRTLLCTISICTSLFLGALLGVQMATTHIQEQKPEKVAAIGVAVDSGAAVEGIEAREAIVLAASNVSTLKDSMGQLWILNEKLEVEKKVILYIQNDAVVGILREIP